jgi:hypothetical protein
MRTFFFHLKGLISNLYGEDLGTATLDKLTIQQFRKKLPASIRNEPTFLALLEKSRDLGEIISMAQTLLDIKAQQKTPVEINSVDFDQEVLDFQGRLR